jgi:ABC-type sugar transport system ATPase subunit
VTLIRLEEVSKRFDAPNPIRGAIEETAGKIGIGVQKLLSPEMGRYFNEMRHGPWLAPAGVALNGLNLLVRSGETLAILGPSGCGKTSLLRVVAGLLDPDAGRVYFNNRDVTTESPAERRIGMVFQNYALYPHMEGWENLAFFFRVNRRETEIPERVRVVSEMMGVGFERLLPRRPPHMSAGERQRVAIARCIVREPSVFLFDEPLSNLDARLRVQTRVEIKRLLMRYHSTCLYVTHDQTEAIALGDRVAVMRAGQIEQVGTMGEVYARPASAFVASFVGSPPMNIWPAHAGDETVHVGPFRLPDFPRLRHRPPAGASLLCGIRPEHLALDRDGPLEMSVDWVEAHLPERRLLARGTLGQWPAAALIADDPPAGVRIGDRLRLSADWSQVHLFDAESGKRLT